MNKKQKTYQLILFFTYSSISLLFAQDDAEYNVGKYSKITISAEDSGINYFSKKPKVYVEFTKEKAGYKVKRKKNLKVITPKRDFKNNNVTEISCILNRNVTAINNYPLKVDLRTKGVEDVTVTSPFNVLAPEVSSLTSNADKKTATAVGDYFGKRKPKAWLKYSDPYTPNYPYDPDNPYDPYDIWKIIKKRCKVIDCYMDHDTGKSTLTFNIPENLPFNLDEENMDKLFLDNGITKIRDNFIEESWSKAFKLMHEKLSREYAFTVWRNIDWDSKYKKYSPLVKDAEKSNDKESYIIALRQYVASIPDGHVNMPFNPKAGLQEKIMRDQLGGGYGLAITGLKDGSIIANIVTKDGPAAKAGIEFGAEIINWNENSIASAINEIVPIWILSSCATDECKRLQQYRFLVRAPVGTTVSITYKNSNDSESKTVSLTAEDDNLQTLNDTYFFATSKDQETPVSHKILNSGYGYIKVTSETDTGDDGSMSETQKGFEKAIKEFVNNNTSGLIIDLRHNDGGDDLTAARLAGYFYTERKFYEYACNYNPVKCDFEIATNDDDSEIWIEPQTPYYGNPVIVMVGPGCISSGEGVAMAIQKLPQANVVSFYGTNGSFGMVGDMVDQGIGLAQMPGAIITYPFGRSLNSNKVIQLDSNGHHGGVIPDIRVPLTRDTLIENVEEGTEGKDPELDYAIKILDANLGL